LLIERGAGKQETALAASEPHFPSARHEVKATAAELVAMAEGAITGVRLRGLIGVGVQYLPA
jgi:hypothetical protein